MSISSKKRRIAFWSPLPPQRSGISDYSVELLGALTELCDVELFVDDSYVPSPDLYARFAIYPDTVYDIRRAQAPFDIDVYQIGNHALFHGRIYERALAHPGLVVLHDLSLFGLHSQLPRGIGEGRAFLDEVEYDAGPEARAHALDMLHGKVPYDGLAITMTRRLIESSLGIIVHSAWAHDLLRERYPEASIFFVHHGALISDDVMMQRRVRERYGLPRDQLVVGVFGGVSPMKRHHIVVEAFRWLHTTYPRTRLLLAGREDEHEAAYIERVRATMRDIQPRDAILRTGEVAIDQLHELIQAVDLVINLRWPTAGETSGVMMRAFGAGRAVVTSDTPQFREYDERFCWRLPIETDDEGLQLMGKLAYAATHLDDVRAAGVAAREFVEREATWEIAARAYLDAIEQVLQEVRQAQQAADDYLYAYRHRSEPARTAGVNVIGDFTAASGLSEAARTILGAVARRGIPASYTELLYTEEKRAVDRRFPHIHLPQGNIYPTNLLFYNMNVLRTISEEQLRALTHGKYTAAYWFWELPEIPDSLRPQFKRVDEIWVASNYVRESMAPKIEGPVTVIPLPVEVPTSPHPDRAAFGLPANRYVFLFSFSAMSTEARKNSLGVVEAFERAFGRPDADAADGPLLVIKAHHLDRRPALGRELRGAVARVGGVLLEGSYPRRRMNDLLACADAYVSLHRAEGFGLGMAESMYLGKPVVATGYSANLDFMDAANSYLVDYYLRPVTLRDHRHEPADAYIYEPGQVWAEPDVGQAAALLRHLYEHQEEGRARGRRAAADIRRYCGPEVVGRLVEERLEAIEREQSASSKIQAMQGSARWAGVGDSALYARDTPSSNETARALARQEATPGGALDRDPEIEQIGHYRGAAQGKRDDVLDALSARGHMCGINVIGDLTAATGIGEATRSLLDVMLQRGTPVGVTELQYDDRRAVDMPAHYASLPRGNIFPINLLYYNIHAMHTLSDEKLRTLTQGKYTIAYWVWELPEIPETYRREFNRVDEIWVASNFVRDSMLTVADVPVVVIPHPIDVPTSPHPDRAAFGLPEGRYLFLFTFSAASTEARKNSLGVVEAFGRAFGRPDADAADGPLLVIKAHHLDLFSELQRELRGAVARVGGVLLEGSYPRRRMNDLLACADAYVSLHRAEGFGLGMAESMYLGKPVVATGYSANLDFMDAANSYLVDYYLRPVTLRDHRYHPDGMYTYEPGQVCAEPDVGQAAALLRHLYEHQEEGRARGRRAAADIRRYCGPEVVGRLVEERLEAIRLEQPVRDRMKAMKDSMARAQARHRELMDAWETVRRAGEYYVPLSARLPFMRKLARVRSVGFLLRTAQRVRLLGVMAERQLALNKMAVEEAEAFAQALTAIGNSLTQLQIQVMQAGVDRTHPQGMNGALQDMDGRLQGLQKNVDELEARLRLNTSHTRLLEQRVGGSLEGRSCAAPLLSGDELVVLIEQLEREIPALSAVTRVEISIQDSAAEGAVARVAAHLGDRLGSFGRAANDAWYHVDFTGAWARPTLFDNMMDRLAPYGFYILVTDARRTEKIGSEKRGLSLLVDTIISIGQEKAARVLVWQREGQEPPDAASTAVPEEIAL